MSNSTVVITEALTWAQSDYKIITSSCAYDFEGGKLIGVNAIGAVMAKNGLVGIPNGSQYFPYKGWLKDCCKILSEDTYWIWRFEKGFNQGLVLRISRSDHFMDSKTDELDEVSSFGVKLRKKYVK